MELIIISILSIIVSYGLDFATSLKIIKDLADEGYKIDMEKIDDYSNQLNQELNENKLSKVIPIYNIVSSLNKLKNYNEEKPTIIYGLTVLNLVIPMTKEELEEYNKKPTIFKALIINTKSPSKKEETEIVYSFNDGDEISKIYFVTENGYRIITKTEGPISNLSKLEQRAILEDKLAETMSNVIMSIPSEDLKNFQTMSTEELKKYLEDLRDYLISLQDDKDEVIKKSLRKRKKK